MLTLLMDADSSVSGGGGGGGSSSGNGGLKTISALPSHSEKMKTSTSTQNSI